MRFTINVWDKSFKPHKNVAYNDYHSFSELHLDQGRHPRHKPGFTAENFLKIKLDKSHLPYYSEPQNERFLETRWREGG